MNLVDDIFLAIMLILMSGIVLRDYAISALRGENVQVRIGLLWKRRLREPL